VEYLTEDEMQRFEAIVVPDGSLLAQCRDLFIFQMYTGLSFSDAQAFDISDYRMRDGRWVNNGERIKTGVPYVSQLLPQAVEVLERYGMQVPKINNTQYNVSLKIIQQACGIKTRLHSHLGRHTFGTRMQALGAKLENVQKMMGHRDIRMTQRYAKVLAESVRDDFSMIEDKLAKKPK
jgi:integrase